MRVLIVKKDINEPIMLLTPDRNFKDWNELIREIFNRDFKEVNIRQYITDKVDSKIDFEKYWEEAKNENSLY